MSNNLKDEVGGFISTREAAARLGVALSTVQAWVETGVLPAWKTAGGHRRIPSEAVEKIYAKQKEVSVSSSTKPTLKVLVVEDDEVQRALYEHQFSTWGLPVQLQMAADGFEGLMLIGRHAPDLVITDLAMPEMDGFKMIHRLTSQLSQRIIVVTALSSTEIEAQGGIPSGIPVYPKPIPFAVLRLLIEQMVNRRQLAA
ncbi:MAG: response regulator [Sideroxydans sp.]|nr:response regulator [Sideroxydans sp.]